MQHFKFAIGQFFLVIGVIMLMVFFVTGESGRPQYLLFFGGALSIAAGIALMTKNRAPTSGESARFKRVRSMQKKARERREKKRQKLEERRERDRSG